MALGPNDIAPRARIFEDLSTSWSMLRSMFPSVFTLGDDWDAIDELIEEKEFGGLWWW